MKEVINHNKSSDISPRLGFYREPPLAEFEASLAVWKLCSERFMAATPVRAYVMMEIENLERAIIFGNDYKSFKSKSKV